MKTKKMTFPQKSVQDLIDQLEKGKKDSAESLQIINETCILWLDDVQKLIEKKIDELNAEYIITCETGRIQISAQLPS